MSTDLKHILRAIAGIAGLFVLVMLVWGYVGDYRQTKTTSGGETSGTVDASGTVSAVAGKVITVTIDGLNFRDRPKSDAKAIRGLEKGEKLTLVSQSEGWYEAKDAKGIVGWISSNPQYSKVEE